MPKRALIVLTVLILIVCAVVLGFWLRAEPESAACRTNPALETKKIWGETQAVDVEIARSGADKTLGLSGRDCLNYATGMLFTYELTGDYCFWMKDMNFPIDMIWLDDEQKVITIHSDVSPDTYPNSLCPDRPAQTILEVDAGFAARAGWQVGTQFAL